MGSTIDKLEGMDELSYIDASGSLTTSGALTINDSNTITFSDGTSNLMYYNTPGGINTITLGSTTWINHNLDVRSKEDRISQLEIQISSLQLQLQQMLSELNQLKLDGFTKKTNRRTLFKSNQ